MDTNEFVKNIIRANPRHSQLNQKRKDNILVPYFMDYTTNFTNGHE